MVLFVICSFFKCSHFPFKHSVSGIHKRLSCAIILLVRTSLYAVSIGICLRVCRYQTTASGLRSIPAPQCTKTFLSFFFFFYFFLFFCFFFFFFFFSFLLFS